MAILTKPHPDVKRTEPRPTLVRNFPQGAIDMLRNHEMVHFGHKCPKCLTLQRNRKKNIFDALRTHLQDYVVSGWPSTQLNALKRTNK